jgi:hypothetical protein
MTAQRRIQRSIRRAMGDRPNARVDAMVRVHPEVDRLLTDRELLRARAVVPQDVARSRTKAREWASRIERRLAVPEHVRVGFAPPPEPGHVVVDQVIRDDGGDTVTVHEMVVREDRLPPEFGGGV